MYIRKLRIDDAPLMLEWMHDLDVTENLSTNFTVKTLEDCESFIAYSNTTSDDIHMAIASDADEYMGTVSLKHIDYAQMNAEFAITMRKEAMAKGYSWYGMCGIFRKAFEDLHLSSVYWCVSEKNARACRFYEKHGFKRMLDVPDDILERYENRSDFRWYSVLNGDDYRNINLEKGVVAGCKVVKINTIPTTDAGELSFFEANKDVSFDIKRIYYISKVPEGTRRGFHAHKKLKQLLFCPYGSIQLLLENGGSREEITLNDPSVGVVIDHPVWREMLWLEKNSVLCVAASDYYDADDYIRDYSYFKLFVKEAGR